MLDETAIPSGSFPGIFVSGDDAEAMDDQPVHIIDRDLPEPHLQVVYVHIDRKMIAHDRRTTDRHPLTIDDIMACCRDNDPYAAWQAKRGIR